MTAVISIRYTDIRHRMRQRPRPDDFRAAFIALGWRGVIAHYGTHGRIVHRWMHEEGWDGLVADRAAYRSRLQDRDRAFRLRVATLKIGDAVGKQSQDFGRHGTVALARQHEGLRA